MGETREPSASELGNSTWAWRRRVQKIARDFKAAMIGPPEVRPPESWEHRQAYREWLAENKKPSPVKDFLMFWFALAFILVTMVGGALYAAHNALGWP